MYIYPNTDLYILKNVSLNNDYDHTIYFGSELAQRNFFSNNLRVKWILNNQSYQRKERGWIQVNLNQNDLWDCTYLMYRNTSYKNKWFYAFILSVDYVNDGVSRINFEIDVMQTWMFDYQLDKCFVEREHTTTDELFENTVDEKLDVGEFYNAQIVRNFYFNCTRVAAVVSRIGELSVSPQLYKNAFGGLFYYPGTIDSQTFKDFLQNYIEDGLEDSVVSVFQYPSFIGSPTQPYDEQTGWGEGYAKQDFTMTGVNFSNVDGYVPKNKKLFCFPYNYLSVSDKEGNGKDFKWELWDENYRGEFLIEGSLIGAPTVGLTPKHYRDITLDRDNTLIYNNFPVCAWSGDAYQVWLAQNMHRINADIAGNLVNIVASSSLPPVMPGIQSRESSALFGMVSLVNNINTIIATGKDMQNMPPKVHGYNPSNILNLQNGSSGFEFKQMTIRNEYAKIIDEYFSRFGYACHRIKVPNRNARQNWTYTKTVGCEIVGNVPSDDIVKIKSIYDKGITFWNDGLNVGYYGDFTNPVYS